LEAVVLAKVFGLKIRDLGGLIGLFWHTGTTLIPVSNLGNTAIMSWGRLTE
jgi:hypothetical protein